MTRTKSISSQEIDKLKKDIHLNESIKIINKGKQNLNIGHKQNSMTKVMTNYNLDFKVDKNETYDQAIRRNHFFRGLSPPQYHKMFDSIYHGYLEETQTKDQDDVSKEADYMLTGNHAPSRRHKYTLRQD